MSAVPVGVDVREHTYGIRVVTPVSGANNFVPGWMVTRVQYFAGAAAGGVTGFGPDPVIVAAGGCVTLEPGGAHRDTVNPFGTDYTCIIEFWIPTPPV